MCRVANAEFDSAVTSGAAARRFVAERLHRWDLDALGDVAALLTSELVNNAVVHSAGSIGLDLSVAGGVLEIGVSDQDPDSSSHVRPQYERAQASSKEALLTEGGRGLLLVDQLADEWGIAVLDTGKQVWFRLDSAGWSYGPECLCADDQADRVALHSGRFAHAAAGPWDG